MDERYVLIRPLGEGGQGRVLLVKDSRRLGIPVALKRLGLVGEQKASLALEFQRLSKLRHPSLARAYDFGEDNEGVYFTSEFVDGPELPAWSKSQDRETVVRAFGSLLRALALIHSRDLVHGDVSPANVLMAGIEDGRGRPRALPKLLDLGGACRPGETGTGTTAGYAAPEMLTGRGALPASDLYAVGALLAETLHGVHPFGKGDASETVQRQLEGESTLPDEEISPVAALIGDLLNPDPAARPSSALETLKRLEEATEISLGLTLTDLTAEDLPAPAMVQRETEKAALLGVIDQLADSGKGGVVVVEGQRGSGRSALLQEAAWHAQLNGVQVIGQVGLAARADDILGALASQIPPESLTPGAVKVLGPWLDSRKGPFSTPFDSWSASVAFAAVEALTAASESKPQLFIVDDFSSSDKLTREVVCAAARALTAARSPSPRAAILVAAGRDEEPSIKEIASGVTIGLEALNQNGIERLVTSMLPGVTWPRELAKTIFLASAGIPGSAEQLVRQAVGPEGQAGIRERIRGLVNDLASETRTLLAAVGMLSNPVEVSVLCEAGVRQPAVLDLMRSGFFFESSGTLSTRVRAAEEAASAALEMSDAHAVEGVARSIADALVSADDLENAALLFAAARESARAAEAYGRLARAARDHGDFSGAAEWFERALAQCEDESDAPSLVRDAMETWQAIGWYDFALQVLGRAGLETSQETRIRAELTMEMGRYKETLELIDAATAEGSSQPDLDGFIAACECQLGNYERALATVQQTLGEGGRAISLKERARLEQVGGLACTYLSRIEEASRWYAAAKDDFEKAEDLKGQLKVSANIGMLLRLRGNLVEARDAYDRAINIARRIGDRPREALHLMNRATISQVACNFEEAHRDYLAALDIATVLGNLFRTTQVEVNLSDLLLDMGEVAAASEMALRALKRSRTIGHHRLEVRALMAAGAAALRAGALLRAERLLGEARRRLSAGGDEAGRVSADLQLISLYMAQGDFKRVRSLACDTVEITAKRGRYRENARASLLLAEAKMSEGGDMASALAHLEQAEHALKREPSPEFLWRLELFRSRALKALGRPEEAAAALKRGESVFKDVLGRVPEQFRDGYLSRAEAPELAVAGRVSKEDESSNRRVRDLEMLMEINQELTRERDPKRLLSLIMERAVELTGAERGMVVMPKGDAFAQVVCYQISDEAEKSFSRSVAEKVVREGRAVLAVDALDDERFRAFVSVNAMKLRSILAVPLQIKRHVVGAIYLDSRLRTGVFTDADRRMLEAFGAQAAVALETARLISENTQKCSELANANNEIQSLTDQLREKLEHSEVKLRRVGALLEQTQKDVSERLRKSGIIGQSVAMQAVLKMIDRIALADVPVYVFGASGTGKELAARAIHSGSERREKPFVPINCGALPPKLLASELFGHKKGAFTGAVGDRPGLFRLADQGTLFLDEVSDMDKEMQTHLLRVLQDGTLRSLGDTEEVSVDVRILSASNRDLEVEVAEGRFREDLFYRLNVVRIDIPPLADRREDIPLLVEFLLRRHAKGGLAPVFTKGAMDILMGADWPGNVRELENEVQRAMAMATEGEPIRSSDLSPRFSETGITEQWSGKGTLKERVSHFEGVVIKRMLMECGENATKAAVGLGISRATLYKKLERYGIMR